MPMISTIRPQAFDQQTLQIFEMAKYSPVHINNGQEEFVVLSASFYDALLKQQSSLSVQKAPFVSLAETFASLDKADEMDFDVDFDVLRHEQRKLTPENFDLSIFDDE